MIQPPPWLLRPLQNRTLLQSPLLPSSRPPPRPPPPPRRRLPHNNPHNRPNRAGSIRTPRSIMIVIDCE